jgi:hypothetical protein
LGVLCPRAKRKVDEDDSLSQWQYMAFLLLTSKSTRCAICMAPRTFDQEAFYGVQRQGSYWRLEEIPQQAMGGN